jgi:hypothetical protein
MAHSFRPIHPAGLAIERAVQGSAPVAGHDHAIGPIRVLEHVVLASADVPPALPQ